MRTIDISWTPNKYSRLFSLHFKQDCFISCQARVTLKPDAVPTIFYPHFHVKAKVRHTRVSKNTTVSKTDSDTQKSEDEASLASVSWFGGNRRIYENNRFSF
uniref:THAP domain-containing protein 1 n=1 Tax=Sander lucioperca TaxID=283035 RepID=A0A8C9YT68_SANLU